jgi:rod shape-determining protein MreD
MSPLARAVPAGTVFAASLLLTAPLGLPWGAFPNLALAMLLGWAIAYPTLFPAWVSLLLGAAHDLLMGLPFGISAVVFPLATVAVRFADRWLEAHNPRIDWGYAAALVLGAQLLAWALLAFVGRPVPLLPLLAQGLLTAACHPAATRLVARLQRRLARD